MSRKTAVEMFNELAERGLIKPPLELGRLELPTTYRRVPSILTYGVSTPQSIGNGAHAELGLRSSRDRSRTE